jgi:hypothetical protein
MNIAISDEVRMETTKCPYDFSCLNTGQCGYSTNCEIKRGLFHNTLIVVSRKIKNDLLCPYATSLGDVHLTNAHICSCPTHFALYLQT